MSLLHYSCWIGNLMRDKLEKFSNLSQIKSHQFINLKSLITLRAYYIFDRVFDLIYMIYKGQKKPNHMTTEKPLSP